jgi:hypothetical protein
LYVGTGASTHKVEADANSIQGVNVSSQAPSDGQVYIYDAATQLLIPGDPIVSGPDAPGIAPTRNPVQIGAYDGSVVRRVLSDSSGNLIVSEKDSIAVTQRYAYANLSQLVAFEDSGPGFAPVEVPAFLGGF